jgi:alpha,alpha-trehalase
VESCYEQTGHLWEKYNVVKGNAEVVDEYTMPTMLGWTFGVYVYFCKLLGREMQ